jgi:predicted sulfurtransferase
MYCTGGIRCEKASAYLKHLGIENVFQLQGGIHRYLEQFPDGGRFKGKNFVFDQRVMMASHDETITGKCEKCQRPYDTMKISGSSSTRCAYCRMHILLCDTCLQAKNDSNNEQTHLYCEEHVHLVEGDVVTLEQKAQSLREIIMQEAVGRKKKGKRRSLRKQLETIEQRIDILRV